MPEVCFVLMPYISLEHPSIAIGILKGCLNRAGITSSALYGNLTFAEQIGLEYYLALNRTIEFNLLGEWTFSHLAFPDLSLIHI